MPERTGIGVSTYLRETGIGENETVMSNALLTMYCKYEEIADVESLFERLPLRNIVNLPHQRSR
ncbi:hypothetical protein J1N35_019425 [Gossypium stocksii]|uniref:Uncharacterized protein n=1 Tax=Gossypium stocksii TaxID=47602 RepID=A0A9D4A7L0_9ROSI|nr:hypothetical protein J1N35_019425 [Gossypium stocksii]